jgi:hypothetical protein
VGEEGLGSGRPRSGPVVVAVVVAVSDLHILRSYSSFSKICTFSSHTQQYD